VSLARAAREGGIALRTAERWLYRYRQHGLPGLVRKIHTNRGQRKLEPELQRLIEGLTLRRPALSVAVIHRQAGRVAKERGWAIPSYACVHAIIRALDPALVTLAQAGPKAYGEQYDLLHRREASRPNEIWQADHTPLDIWVLDAKDLPARPRPSACEAAPRGKVAGAQVPETTKESAEKDQMRHFPAA
jgi:putative transposase